MAHVNVKGEKFLIDGKLTYKEIQESNPEAHGLLMNSRFIQGIFDDKAKPERFARFGMEPYDPEKNTDNLITALPQWYAYGLRAFTVGLQGGGPVNTIDDLTTIDNSPFRLDGKSFDSAYEARLNRLIRAADKIGMVVIVSFFYQGQAHRLQDGEAVRNAVKTACAVLKNIGCNNVIIEVANENTVGNNKLHPIVYTAEGMAYLIELAREQSGMLVGCSGGGGEANEEIARASDIILVHGNGCTRQHYYDMIKRVRGWKMNKPIVCNEDSQCFGQLEVAYKTRTSWGYYNNLTKQEPPADWSITPGEDRFFAWRMAKGIGISVPEIPLEEQFYLQGFEPLMTVDNKRWIRLASLYPENINFVEFYHKGQLVDIAYDEPFLTKYVTTWLQNPFTVAPDDKDWMARVIMSGTNEVHEVHVPSQFV